MKTVVDDHTLIFQRLTVENVEIIEILEEMFMRKAITTACWQFSRCVCCLRLTKL